MIIQRLFSGKEFKSSILGALDNYNKSLASQEKQMLDLGKDLEDLEKSLGIGKSAEAERKAKKAAESKASIARHEAKAAELRAKKEAGKML